jgi:hypothetical protein
MEGKCPKLMVLSPCRFHDLGASEFTVSRFLPPITVVMNVPRSVVEGEVRDADIRAEKGSIIRDAPSTTLEQGGLWNSE